MRSRFILAASTGLALVGVVAAGPAHDSSFVSSGIGPTLQSVGPLTFGPGGVLYSADPRGAAIYAIELGAVPTGAVAGTKDIAGVKARVAAMLGTAADQIAFADLAVDPRNGNSYLAVMRGQGASAQPALLRVDGAGTMDVVALEALKFSSIALPNAPTANPTARTDPRTESVTDMAFQNGKLYIAGLSNEEFSSKLRAVAYPFVAADRGTSVEIFHGNHGGLETRSPVYAFVPYMIGNEANLIGAYLCTPLVKFPVSSLTPGAKVRGTTIAELGAGNRPIDMVLYKKDGKEFLLMSNTSRGVMKIPTTDFASATPITAPVKTPTAGIQYETIASMTQIQQLDLLDAGHVVVLRGVADGGVNLESVPLP